MRQKVGERWTKAQALGQRVNFPYCVMAKVKGSWLVARNRLQVSKERLCPSLKPVPNKKKMMRGHKDVSFFWIQDILCSVKSSKWKFPPQSEEEQCKDFSFGKHEDLPGDPAGLSHQETMCWEGAEKPWAKGSPGLCSKSGRLRESSSSAVGPKDRAWGASSQGSLSRAATPSNR